MKPVITLTAGDNYIYLYTYGNNKAIVIDPGQADTVLNALSENNLHLTSVLLTHHHFDHTGGVKKLTEKTGCQVISSKHSQMPDSENFSLSKIATPGHTKDSLCYYIQPSNENAPVVFTGDTLFIGGCGRPMECDEKTMWDSLKKIIDLPDQTQLYPGHNYTAENYEFALTIDPDNEQLKQLLKSARQSDQQGLKNVPSTVSKEKSTNIFLRACSPQIKAALEMPNASDAETFSELRKRKNIFG